MIPNEFEWSHLMIAMHRLRQAAYPIAISAALFMKMEVNQSIGSSALSYSMKILRADLQLSIPNRNFRFKHMGFRVTFQ